jgi:hypothetical protein
MDVNVGCCPSGLFLCCPSVCHMEVNVRCCPSGLFLLCCL